jgi:hypothetical protein
VDGSGTPSTCRPNPKVSPKEMLILARGAELVELDVVDEALDVEVELEDVEEDSEELAEVDRVLPPMSESVKLSYEGHRFFHSSMYA